MYILEELKQVLFFDIETKPEYKISDELKQLWKEKYHFKSYLKELEILKKQYALDNEILDFNKVSELDIVLPSYNDIYIKYAPLYPEFSKVLCIVIGMINDEKEIEVITIHDSSEKNILIKFNTFLVKNSDLKLGGFNIKGFDIPYLNKRYIQHQIKIPKLLSTKGKKPWEVTFVDLMEDYKGIGWENISLDLLCSFLGIDSPKSNLSGPEISRKLLEKLITEEDVCKYCEKDVTATIKCAMKMIL